MCDFARLLQNNGGMQRTRKWTVETTDRSRGRFYQFIWPACGSWLSTATRGTPKQLRLSQGHGLATAANPPSSTQGLQASRWFILVKEMWLLHQNWDFVTVQRSVYFKEKKRDLISLWLTLAKSAMKNEIVFQIGFIPLKFFNFPKDFPKED